MIPYNAGAGAVSPVSALFVTQVLGGDVSSVGVMGALTALASVPGSGLWGALSDRTGRRGPFIVLGLIGYGVPVVLFGLSQTLLVAYVLSFVMGFLSLALNPAASALIAEANPRERLGEALATFNWLAGIGAVAGLVIGAAWMELLPRLVGQNLALRELLILSGLTVVIAGVIAAIWLPAEAKPPRSRHTAGQNEPQTAIPESIGNRRLHSDPWLRYLLAYFLGRLSTNLALTPFAIFMKQSLGAPDSLVLIAYVVNQFFPIVAYGWMSRVVRRTGAVRLMMFASAGRAFGLFLGSLALVFGAGPVGIGLAMLLYGPMIGITWAGIAVGGPMVVMDMVPPEKAGAGMGLYNAVSNVAAIAGAYFSGVGVLAIGYAGIFDVSAAIGLAGAAAYLLVRDTSPAPARLDVRADQR